MPKSFWPYEYDVHVTWRDLDAAGHVNNAVYLTYMETARTMAYLSLVGGERATDLDLILARATIDFRASATLGDRLVVQVRPTRVGETSFTFGYRVLRADDGTLVCEGDSVNVCFDYETNKKKRIPDALREKLSEA